MTVMDLLPSGSPQSSPTRWARLQHRVAVATAALAGASAAATALVLLTGFVR